MKFSRILINLAMNKRTLEFHKIKKISVIDCLRHEMTDAHM